MKEIVKVRKKQFALRLGDKQKETLREIANAEDVSISVIIRRAINEYVERSQHEHGKVHPVNFRGSSQTSAQM